jgi:hypothetical protein
MAPPAVGLILAGVALYIVGAGDSSPADAVSHPDLARFCDCRRRLPLRRGP